MRLSILDQSPIISGHTPAQAIHETIKLVHFISAQGGDAVMHDYKRNYQPSKREPVPQALLCAFVICADSAEEAERLAGSIDLRRLNTDYGVNAPVPSHEEVRNYPYTEADRGRMAHHRGRVVLGTPATVRDKLLKMKEMFEADELMAITITGDYDSRMKSYELLAESFGLCHRGCGIVRYGNGQGGF